MNFSDKGVNGFFGNWLAATFAKISCMLGIVVSFVCIFTADEFYVGEDDLDNFKSLW